MRVHVEPYNPLWPVRFAAIKEDLEKILHTANVSYKSIEHFGSTSVPGLAAKPCIDIDIVVTEDQAEPVIAALEQTGLYENRGDFGIPQRYAMVLLPQEIYRPPISQALYVAVDGCQSLRNHRTLRDVCRRNDELRNEYGRVKLELAQKEFVDIFEYVIGKNEIVSRILTEGGMGDEAAAIQKINLEAGPGGRKADQSRSDHKLE